MDREGGRLGVDGKSRAPREVLHDFREPFFRTDDLVLAGLEAGLGRFGFEIETLEQHLKLELLKEIA